MYRLKLHKRYYGGIELYFDTKEQAERFMEEQIPSEVWHKVEITLV